MTIVLNLELFSNKNVEKLIKDVKEVMRILAQLMENQKNYLNYKNSCLFVKITRSGLCFLLFSLSFSFDLFFIFLFLEHLGLGLEVISHNIDHRT